MADAGCMKPHRILPIALVLAVLIAPVAFGASGSTVASGDYAGKGAGLTATVSVAGSGDAAKLAYTMKSNCGRSKGSVALKSTPAGALKGKQASRNGKRAIKAVVWPVKPGELDGTVRYKRVKKPAQGKLSAEGKRSAKPKRCRAKRTFSASYDYTIEPQEVHASVGHYTGSGTHDGLPVSFDVSFDPARPDALQISNLSFQTRAECWEDLDDDGNDDVIDATVSGLGGEIDSDGDFYIDETPDEDSEYEVEGNLRDGQATMEITVGGRWATDGTPMTGGPLECDSWGEGYTAAK